MAIESKSTLRKLCLPRVGKWKDLGLQKGTSPGQMTPWLVQSPWSGRAQTPRGLSPTGAPPESGSSISSKALPWLPAPSSQPSGVLPSVNLAAMRQGDTLQVISVLGVPACLALPPPAKGFSSLWKGHRSWQWLCCGHITRAP